MQNAPAPSLDTAFGPSSASIDFDLAPAGGASKTAPAQPADHSLPVEPELDESLPPPRLIKNLDPGMNLDLEQWLAHRYAELRLFAGGIRGVVGHNATGTAADFDREFSEFCRALAEEGQG